MLLSCGRWWWRSTGSAIPDTGNPVSVRLFGQAEIRCRFVFSGKNDEPTPDFPRISRNRGPDSGAFQASHQPPAVGIVLDDVLPAVTPCHDMIDGIGILDPQSSCHHPIESSCRVSFNKKF